MKYTKIILVLTCMLASGCTDRYEQRYQTYNDFKMINQRNKTWFPGIISTDAYNLRNASYLDPLCAFGTFSYTNNHFYDSIFNKTEINKISFSKFEQKVNEQLKRRPDWFLKTDTVLKSDYQAIQQDRFYIVRNPKFRNVYFILSN